jgi:hypothetical protein
MRMILRHVLGVGLIGCVLCAVCCQGMPAGPSLSNLLVTNLSWKSTTSDVNLCCCRVNGKVTNNNTVPVHVSIKFKGYGAIPTDPVATTEYFIENLRPSATQNIDAAGFIVPCSAITSLKYEVEVKGLASPPQ